jgi:5-methylcytosine-specific restriction protein A
VFEIGKEYKRSADLHEKYGGQQRGGIATPAKHPVIFIFTSDAGEQHGYKDEYREDGIFWYPGEGQVGDMEMAAGNKAILNHSQNTKIIHVFESTRKAYVRYLGTAECLGYHEEVRPDRNGNDRKAFVFHLDIDSIPKTSSVVEPASTYGNNDSKSLKKKSINELRKAALAT